ncbi:MAG: SPOR domain-containing protein [Candidatus Zixiibacteriota bacterium]|nr:MAG: SPOR domain-containing protein [candidate division Zixibacteria bacterium]
MNFHKFVIPGLLMFLLIFGCSKKKEEAAELEQEMLGQKDTVAETVEAPADTMEALADASAVGEEVEYMPPSAPMGSGYTVQVAGCEDRVYAEYLIDKYVQRGYEPYLTTASVAGQTYYRVRIGSFETLAEAKILKNELADRFSIDAWIDYVQ